VGLRRLISVAERENRASIRIMQKLGLTFEREFEAEGCELVQYAMERAQWAGQRRASEGCG
jgi:RimJ/RimL family protein N-acetyltransferase